MKYPPLQEPCKTAIAKGYCTGCNKLEVLNFTGNPKCEGAKPPQITEIKEILGIQERIKL